MDRPSTLAVVGIVVVVLTATVGGSELLVRGIKRLARNIVLTGGLVGLPPVGLRAEGARVLGKDGRYRTVYLTQGAWDAVAEYLDERGVDDPPALFIGFSPRDYHSSDQREKRVLPHNRLTANGARVVVQRLRSSLATTPELAKILAEFRSPHVARHTAATTLLESSGGDVRLVQEVLGHASLQTLQVYTEITDKRKAAAYKRFGTFLGEKGVDSGQAEESRTREE